MTWARFVTILTISGYLISLSWQQSCNTATFSFDVTKTDDNPLRGFYSYQDSIAQDTIKSSIEYSYIPMGDVMTGVSTFNWSPIENLLEDIKSRGRQTVFRVFVDYPSEPSALPTFLTGVTMTRYEDFGGGYSPDYENEDFVTAMESFISNMGQKYDGDNRIAMIQVGFLGHWGEWHTYPTEALMASTTVQRRIIAAYNASFSITQLVVSADFLQYDPNDYITSTAVGFHDDDFGASTCETDGFRDRLTANGWLSNLALKPVGGEVQPSIQQSTFASDSEANAFVACLKSVNASALLFYDLFNDYPTGNINRALVAHRAMGYHFVLEQVIVSTPSTCSNSVPFGAQCVTLDIDVRNAGIARFYYPLSLVVDDGVDAALVVSNSLHSLMPSGTATRYTTEFYWTDDRTTFDLTIKLKSDYVLSPVKWAVSDVDTSTGAVTVNVPSGCSTTSTTTPSMLNTPSSNSPTNTPSRANSPSANSPTSGTNGPSSSSVSVVLLSAAVFAMTLTAIAL